MGNVASTKKEKQNSLLIQTCVEHDGSINCMELSDDGSVLATGSDDKTIRLWTTKTDQIECIGLLEGHDDYVTSLAIAESFILSSSADKTIRKWDMSTCECLLIYRGHASTVNRIIYSGDFIFSISYDRTARCWDFDTGECVRAFMGHKMNVCAIIFLPNEQENMNDAVKFLAENKKIKKTMAALKAPKTTFKISGLDKSNANEEENEDDGDEAYYSKDLIITGSLDSFAKSWSFETGECIHTFRGHTSAITCLATDALGKILFSGSTDHTIRSWDIMKGESLKVFQGHQTTIINLIAQKKILYSTSSDHTARSWVMEFGDCTRVYKGHTHTIGCVIIENGLIFTGSGDTHIKCFDAKSGALLHTFKGHTGSVNCLKLVENRLFSGSFDNSLQVWDVSTIQPEQFGKKKQISSKVNSDLSMQQSTVDQLSIENEINYDLRVPSSNGKSSKMSRSYDSRSESDSGILDDRDGVGTPRMKSPDYNPSNLFQGK